MDSLLSGRLVCLHPAEETENDESVLMLRKGAVWYPVSASQFLDLKKWMEENLRADCILVRNRWISLSASTKDFLLPDNLTVHARASVLGKRTAASALGTPVGGATTKKLKALEEYKPTHVEPDILLGPVDDLLLALRWLYLLHQGKAVNLEVLRSLRRDKARPKECVYYPGLLAMLKSVSLGQQGLLFRGQGYGNVHKSDIQGFVNGKRRAASEVKVEMKMATDKDPHGITGNALDIKQEADSLRQGIEETTDSVRIGCLFSRMDRFFVVKFWHESNSVQITPSFPPAQVPDKSPHKDFILMKFKWLDECNKPHVTLSDILPAQPTAGFRSLVSYVEEIRKLFDLPSSTVRLVGSNLQELRNSEVSFLAYGHKSLVLLKRTTGTVVKVCLPENARNEIQIHSSADGHENIRGLIDYGTVDVGNMKEAFHFLELEGYGDPLSAQHLPDLEATEKLWNQALAALRHLHSKGVLHRDVKPDNMIIIGGMLKLNDFDVSCFKGDGRDTSELVGTTGFQSPSDMCPYMEEDDILALALAFFYAKYKVAVVSREARLHILQRELHPDRFPECMRQTVSAALVSLALN